MIQHTGNVVGQYLFSTAPNQSKQATWEKKEFKQNTGQIFIKNMVKEPNMSPDKPPQMNYSSHKKPRH